MVYFTFIAKIWTNRIFCWKLYDMWSTQLLECLIYNVKTKYLFAAVKEIGQIVSTWKIGTQITRNMVWFTFNAEKMNKWNILYSSSYFLFSLYPTSSSFIFWCGMYSYIRMNALNFYHSFWNIWCFLFFCMHEICRLLSFYLDYNLSLFYSWPWKFAWKLWCILA